MAPGYVSCQEFQGGKDLKEKFNQLSKGRVIEQTWFMEVFSLSLVYRQFIAPVPLSTVHEGIQSNLPSIGRDLA